MKISVVTPTYNRCETLIKLYNSLIKNSTNYIQIEWIIADDGSTDETQSLVEELKNRSTIEVKYFYQKNAGKMSALNKVINEVTGDLIIVCDSDDYFSNHAFEIIYDEYQQCKSDDNLYAMCFLKYDQNNCNMGNLLKNEKTTMFDLYFKEGEDGEKALVFFADKRKEFSYKLEHDERFITEARMYHEMDEKYTIRCVNKPIMICEYREDGYSENINKVFKANPYGYYEYFKEILKKDFKGVTLKKRLYVVKHYILFAHLTGKKLELKEVTNSLNKILLIFVYLPGKIKSGTF